MCVAGGDSVELWFYADLYFPAARTDGLSFCPLLVVVLLLLLQITVSSSSRCSSRFPDTMLTEPDFTFTFRFPCSLALTDIPTKQTGGRTDRRPPIS